MQAGAPRAGVRRVAVLGAVLLAVGAGGCTLCKPVVGALTGPVMLFGAAGEGLGRSWGSGWGQCGDGRAALVLLALSSAAGVVGGLVTGVVSDIRWATGDCTDPTLNWYDPFRTNQD
jgi:hypothetical protein